MGVGGDEIQESISLSIHTCREGKNKINDRFIINFLSKIKEMYIPG